MSVTVSDPHVKTLYELALAEESARLDELVHQARCAARADRRECAACLDFEQAWLAAERAVSEFLNGVA